MLNLIGILFLEANYLILIDPTAVPVLPTVDSLFFPGVTV